MNTHAFLILLAFCCVTASWSLSWAPHDWDNHLQIINANETTWSRTYQLWDSDPFYYEIQPLSENCTNFGVSVDAQKTLQPQSSYNVTINIVPINITQQISIDCIITAVNKNTSQSAPFDLLIEYRFTACYDGKNCSGHGQCTEHYQFCKCDAGYFGPHCGCDPKLCSHGSCESYQDTCVCKVGFWGDFCEKKCNCSDFGCRQSNGTCNCDSNHFGANCELVCPNDCTNNGGKCVEGACICPDNWRRGGSCQVNLFIPFIIVMAVIGVAVLVLLGTYCITKRTLTKKKTEYITVQ